MYIFLLSTLIIIKLAFSEQLGVPGLHFDQNTAYASQYNNYEPHSYAYEYGVSDPHTGDHKSQWEVKDKGVVRGGYSLLEPDGTTRIVEYIADDNGFRAVVKKLGTGLHPETVEVHGAVPEVVVPEPVPVHANKEEPYYHTYDGDVHNYENVLGAALQHLEPVSYKQPLEIPHSVDFHGFHPQELVYPGQTNQYYQEVPQTVHHAPIQEVASGYPEIQTSQEETPVFQVVPQVPSESLVPNYVQNHHQPLAQSYVNQNHFIVKPEVSTGAVPILQDSVEYHGYTGNNDDDSAYTQYEEGKESATDEYGDYSHKNEHVVVPPNHQAASNEFLIYFPGAGHK